MKKVFAIVVCLVICLSFAACGGKGSGGSGSMTLAAYIDSISDEVESTVGSIEGMELELTARGNSLVYSYRYTIDLEVSDVLKSSLSDALDGMDSTFQSVLTSVKNVVPSTESVIVEYLDKNGKLIVSKEFK